MNPMMQQGQMQKPINVQQKMQQPPPQQQQSPPTTQAIRQNMDDFLGAPQEIQRSTLGEMILPQVQKYCDQEFKKDAAKITGMLIDFTVFQVDDILDMLENPTELLERIKEAQNLLIGASG